MTSMALRQTALDRESQERGGSGEGESRSEKGGHSDQVGGMFSWRLVGVGWLVVEMRGTP